MDDALILKHICAGYDHRNVLDQIDLNIKKNQITAIVGPSGCGKSTLLYCMNGLFHDISGTSFSGNIYLGKTDVRELSGDERRKKIGMVSQIPTPFPMSIYKNMTYGMKYYGIKDKKILDEKVKQYLEMAGLYNEVKDQLNKSAFKLSGGQKQRLCIARSLTVEPEILLLDEPCSALDVQSTKLIEELLLQLKEKYTIVIVTHNIGQAKRIADQMIFMLDGRIEEMDTTTNMFTNPKSENTRKFLSGIYG